MNKEEQIEMEHIDAQEHFGECKECQKIFRNARTQAIQEVLGEIEEWAVGRLPAFAGKDKTKEILEAKLFSAKDLKDILTQLKKQYKL